MVGVAASAAAWNGCIACALPAAVTEGVPTPQLDVLVVCPAPAAAAATGQHGGGNGDALGYRVVAQIEGIAVGQTRKVTAAAVEHALRLALPPLPRGVLQLSIDWRGKLCSLAAIPILPPACAAEMAQLWADILQQMPAAAAGASAESSVSSAPLAAAWGTYQAVVGRVAGILALQPPPGLPAAGGKAAGSACPSGRAAVAAMVATAMLSTTAAGPVPAALASAHQKSRFAQLMHLFAAHNMWAVMQLATDCFYGAGASARALYACEHTAPLAAAQAGGTTGSC